MNQTDEYISLAHAAKRCPGRPSANAVWRWCRRGVKSRSGERVSLEHIRVGGKIYTTVEALEHFFAAVTQADVKVGNSIPLKVLSCQGCGACCEAQGSPPFLPEEVKKLPQPLRVEIESYDETVLYSRYDVGLPCLWYDVVHRKCINYEHRPRVCREYEVGGEGCLSWRSRSPNVAKTIECQVYRS